jgi:hypothetical protein
LAFKKSAMSLRPVTRRRKNTFHNFIVGIEAVFKVTPAAEF